MGKSMALVLAAATAAVIGATFVATVIVGAAWYGFLTFLMTFEGT